MWRVYLFFAEITPYGLPGYTNGGDNSSTSLTADRLTNALQFIFAAFGAVALLVITIAGIQYMLSQGEPQKISRAKDTILYALIGLVVAITAFSLVSFVVKWLAG